MIANPYVDGWLGSVGKQLTVVPRVRFPFGNNLTPDTVSRLYERDWMVYPPLYSPRASVLTSWTNLVVRSEDLTNASWTKTNLTPTVNQGTAPDGLGTLNKVLETVTNGQHSAAIAATTAAAETEASIFAKGGLTRTLIKLTFTDSAATAFSAFFNIVSGVALSPSAGVTADIVPLGDSFFRCRIRFTPAAGAGTLAANLATAVGTISYAGSTTAGAYLWGAQVSTGNGAPYVSTTTATRTVITTDVDPADPFAFLVQEEDPQEYSSEQSIVRRAFARVPLTQVVQTFIRVNKPGVSGALPQRVGDYVLAQPNAAVNALDAYGVQTVASDTGPDVGVGGAVTGGTYALSFDGDTTAAIAFNAPASAVQTALNALGSISDRGGVTVTGDYVGGFTVLFAALGQMTFNSASLTTTGGGGVQVSSHSTYYGGFNQLFDLAALPLGTSQFNGGTFTISIFGQTTAAIAYNASLGTVQTELNALSNVSAHGGVQLYDSAGTGTALWGGNRQLAVTIFFEYPAITVNTSSLTPVGSTGTVAIVDGYTGIPGQVAGRTQSITFSGVTVGPRTVTAAAAHGITTADAIFALAGDTFYLIPAGLFTVPAADEIEFDASSGPVASAEDGITIIGKRVRQGYSPGAQNVPCVITSTFYFPGYTPGIATASDIVPPVYEGDSATMLQIILSGVGTINYDVGALEQYRGRMLKLAVTTLKASDL